MKTSRNETIAASSERPLKRIRSHVSLQEPEKKCSNSLATVLYICDSQHRIVQVGGVWELFAKENGGSLSITKVLGKSLFDFISTENTALRELYKEMHKKLLSRERRKYSLPQRCDSGTVTRKITMNISLIDGELEESRQIKYEVTVDEETPRKVFIDIEDIATPAFSFNKACNPCSKCEGGSSDAPATTQCTLCLLVQLPGSTKWVEVDEYMTVVKSKVNVKQGVCAKCVELVNSPESEEDSDAESNEKKPEQEDEINEGVQDPKE